ncbi:hypoxanthine phosphoribosyltransferase [Desulfogranum japonicum]|uniref:hypoxanthine phosphoribosyltransferase n=1 Tax=Desulfogranum japonicum TaxID=231447 RepID=UPI0003FF0607|nr:hypoxanthine phosphoribosyltransferase [Desulfogranum japonicum]
MDTEASLVIGPEQIQSKVVDLGKQITTDYADKSLLILGVLNGAFIFTADLCRAISLDMEIDFIRVASYGSSISSSGEICLRKAPEGDLRGKDILLVEDIVDTGSTLAWLRDYFADQGAASVKICALIDKTERRNVDVHVDYPGFTVEEGFLIGYGMDYAEKYRNLSAIYSLHT